MCNKVNNGSMSFLLKIEFTYAVFFCFSIKNCIIADSAILIKSCRYHVSHSLTSISVSIGSITSNLSDL